MRNAAMGNWLAGSIVVAVVAAIVLGVAHFRTTPPDVICRDGKPDAVIEACTRVVSDPQDPQDVTITLALFRRGYAYFRKNDHDHALLDYDEAFRRDRSAKTYGSSSAARAASLPRELAAEKLRGYSIRALILAQRKQFGPSLQDIEAAFALKPDKKVGTMLYLLRGAIFAEQNDYETAVENFRAAIRADPGSRIAYLNRGDANNKLGKYSLAVEDYDEAVRLGPGKADAYTARCWNNTLLGRLDDALTDCNKALSLDDRDQNAFDTRGFVYLRTGKYKEAQRDYDAALGIDPKLAPSLYGRGVAKIRSGDAASGAADIDAAKQLDQDIVEKFAGWGVKL